LAKTALQLKRNTPCEIAGFSGYVDGTAIAVFNTSFHRCITAAMNQ